MYNILLAILFSLLTYGAVGYFFSWWAAVLPAIAIFTIAFWILSRRTSQQLEAAIAPVSGLLSTGKVGEAQALLKSVRKDFGKWQLQLEKQIDSQLGMLEYMQMRFEAARPLLESSAEVSWTSAVALGCLALRKNDFELAQKYFLSASKTGKKELVAYTIPAAALARRDKTAEALDVCRRGLEAIEGQPLLKKLQSTISNRKNIDPRELGESWPMFFPEEVARDQIMRGRRGPDPYAAQRAEMEKAARSKRRFRG